MQFSKRRSSSSNSNNPTPTTRMTAIQYVMTISVLNNIVQKFQENVIKYIPLIEKIKP
jgi:hypothetical protein